MLRAISVSLLMATYLGARRLSALWRGPSSTTPDPPSPGLVVISLAEVDVVVPPGTKKRLIVRLVQAGSAVWTIRPNCLSVGVDGRQLKRTAGLAGRS